MNDFDSFSMGDIVWLQIKSNRFSFRFKGMPQSVHFTLARNPEKGHANLHLTKEVGNGKNKPRIDIVLLDKMFVDTVKNCLPALFMKACLKRETFKQYSRQQRKGIRVVFLDDVESQFQSLPLASDLEAVWNRHTTMKRGRIRVESEMAERLLPIVLQPSFKALLQQKKKRLSASTFNSPTLRFGVLLINQKVIPFLAQGGACFLFKQGQTLATLLSKIMNPELASTLLNYINQSVQQIGAFSTKQEAEPYSHPFTLYFEKAG